MPQKCALCRSESVYAFLQAKNRTFLRCSDCDLIFVPERFHISRDVESARYRLHENTLLNEGYVRMFLEKIALIHKYCPDIKSVLDYGCGPEPILAELMKRDGFHCDTYDLYFFPDFPDRKYDLVISTEVFEHFRDAGAEISAILQLLRSGGYLAVMTSFHDTVADFDTWWYQSDPTHVNFFGMRSFEWISKHSGLEAVYTNKKDFIILRRKQIQI
ncbi:MAG TPA: class I SAM-dependent methyltransferase [Candidatus Methanoperedens sp.]